jgi:hypothetical protein
VNRVPVIAADLKFLLRRSKLGQDFKSKAALKSKTCQCPFASEFVSAFVAMHHEFRKRGTSGPAGSW